MFSEECEKAGWAVSIWVNARTRRQALQEMRGIAHRAGITTTNDPEGAAASLVAWLNQSTLGPRLLVLDNVENMSDLDGLIPRGAGMSVLITSTTRTSAIGTPVTLGALDPQDASALLLAATGKDDEAAAAEVARELGYLPVALIQAANAIRLLGFTFEEYRVALAELALDEAVRLEPGDQYDLKIGASLRLSREAALGFLRRTSDQLATAGMDVLDALSLLAESGVPRAWLNGLGEGLSWREAVGFLLTSSLIDESEASDMISVHPLLAKVLREDCMSSGRTAEALANAARALRAVIHLKPATFMNAKTMAADVTGQLLAIRAQPWSSGLLSSPEVLWLVMETLRLNTSLYDPYASVALAGYMEDVVRVFGDEDPETLWMMNEVAEAYSAAGRPDLALPIHERAVAGRTSVLGPEHRRTLISRNNLAQVHAAMGNWPEAIRLHKSILADRIRILGPAHEHTLVSQNNLAKAYRGVGNDGRALPLFRQTLASRTEALGPGHPSTLHTRDEIASLLLDLGHVQQAGRLYNDNLQMAVAGVGTDFPLVITLRWHLARFHSITGGRDAELALLKENAHEAERVLGLAHAATYDALATLAQCLEGRGMLEKALRAYEKAEEAAVQVYGNYHARSQALRADIKRLGG